MPKRRLVKCFVITSLGLVFLLIAVMGVSLHRSRPVYIDRVGHLVPEPRFDLGKKFADGLLRACKERGEPDVLAKEYIDKNGHFTVPVHMVRYLTPGKDAFSEGLYRWWTGLRYVYLNSEGAVAVEAPKEAVAVNDFSCGLAAVATAKGPSLMKGFGAIGSYTPDNWGFIDKTGAFVIPPRYKDVTGVLRFSEDLACVSDGENFGFINKQGEWAIPPKFAGARNFSEGLAAVCTDRGWGYINRSGDVVIAAQFSAAEPFSEGLAPVIPRDTGTAKDPDKDKRSHLRCGFIDKSGAFVVPPQFDTFGEFSESLAAVGIGRRGSTRYGYIDTHGAFAIPPQFASAGPLRNGTARVNRSTLFFWLLLRLPTIR